jgi:3-methyladenine DNA glycosylase AlkC
MSIVSSTLTDPRLLEAEAVLAALVLPQPYAALLAAALRAVEAAVVAKRDASEFDAITAKYSAEAQSLADTWDGTSL